MTPDAVLSRYLELVSAPAVDADALYRVLAIDADLLQRWVTALDCAISPASIRSALDAIPDDQRPGLARAQIWSVVPIGNAARLGLDQWRAVLIASCLAELLTADSGLGESEATRLRVLLAGSGVHLARDPLMAELSEFRGVDPSLMVDAHPVLRAFAVSEALEHHGRAQAAAIAQELFALDATQFDQRMQRAERRAAELIEAAGVSFDAADAWFESLWIQAQLAAFSMVMGREHETAGLERLGRQISRSLFAHEPRIFLVNAARTLVEGTGDDDLADLKLALTTSPSRVAVAVRDGVDAVIEDGSDVSIVDRQVLRRLHADSAMVTVLRDGDDVLGAIVFRMSDEDSSQSAALMAGFTAELGHWMGVLRRGAASLREGLQAYRLQHEKRLREIVHEANNPLSIVHNYLHILELRLKDHPETHEPLRLVSAEVRRAASILRKVTDFPSPEAMVAPTEPKFSQLDLNKIVGGVLELIGASATRASVDVAGELEEGALLVTSNADRITQVLTNLARNAVEAMAEGGGSLVIETHRGVYRAGRAGVELVVRDDGPGLPAAVLRQIYEPKTSTKGAGHSGLGLHISARLVAELGGAIDVRTAPGKGTAFAIFLPDMA